jgi:hypothetical protein
MTAVTAQVSFEQDCVSLSDFSQVHFGLQEPVEQMTDFGVLPSSLQQEMRQFRCVVRLVLYDLRELQHKVIALAVGKKLQTHDAVIAHHRICKFGVQQLYEQGTVVNA